MTGATLGADCGSGVQLQDIKRAASPTAATVVKSRHSARDVRTPNITGSTSWDVNGLGKANLGYSSCGSSRVSNSGAMSVTAGSYWACIGSSGGDFNGNNAVVNINARSSNSTYGSSSVVQPSSTRLLFCIKI
nr:MAG TPA: hypothetical protein [Caudoviricetes sp.]